MEDKKFYSLNVNSDLLFMIFNYSKIILILLLSFSIYGCISNNNKKRGTNDILNQIKFTPPNCLDNINSFETDSLLIDYLEKISEENSFYGNDYYLVECNDVSNFSALNFNGKKIILYNKIFFLIISKIANTGKNEYENVWDNPLIKFILYHEMGHLVNNHMKIINGVIKNPLFTIDDRVNAEIEADKFSAIKMYEAGFSNHDLAYFYSLINSLYFTSDNKPNKSYLTHPNYKQRINNFNQLYINYKNENFKEE